MRATLAVLALAGSAAAQAVTQLIVPSSTPQPGCDNSRTGSFNLVIVAANGTSGSSTPAAPAPTKRSAEEGIARRQNVNGHLEMTLTGGILMDSNGRHGYIASNYQFQFDGPPQAGAIYTAGWGICPNGSLALGGQSVFWSCKSGAFSNLYDRNFAPVHCSPVLFYASDGRQDGYSTAPPGPETTGGDQATIPNAGGTQSVNSTATPTPSASTGGAAGNATITSGSLTTATGASASQGGPSSTQTAKSNAASNAAAALAASPAQMVLAWAVGIVGVAVAL